MTTNKGWRRVRSVIAIAGLGIVVAVIILVAYLGISFWHRREAFLQAIDPRVDSQIAADAESLVRGELERLEPDSEIYLRYGKFQSLEGSGYKRLEGIAYAAHGDRISLSRRANFANGTAKVSIIVAGSGPLAIRKRELHPSDRRYDSDIHFGISHPEFRTRVEAFKSRYEAK